MQDVEHLNNCLKINKNWIGLLQSLQALCYITQKVNFTLREIRRWYRESPSSTCLWLVF